MMTKSPSERTVEINERGYEMRIEFHDTGVNGYMGAVFDPKSGELMELMTAEQLRRRAEYSRAVKPENEAEFNAGTKERADLIARSAKITQGLTEAANNLDELNHNGLHPGI